MTFPSVRDTNLRLLVDSLLPLTDRAADSLLIVPVDRGEILPAPILVSGVPWECAPDQRLAAFCWLSEQVCSWDSVIIGFGHLALETSLDHAWAQTARDYLSSIGKDVIGIYLSTMASTEELLPAARAA